MASGQLANFGFIGGEFVKQGDQLEFILKLEYDKSITFEKNNTTSKQVEDFLRSKKYIKSVFSNISLSLIDNPTREFVSVEEKFSVNFAGSSAPSFLMIASITKTDSNNITVIQSSMIILYNFEGFDL